MTVDLGDYDFSGLPVGTKITLPNGHTVTVVDRIQGPSTDPLPVTEQAEDDVLRNAIAVTVKLPITSEHVQKIRFMMDQAGLYLVRKAVVQQPVVVDMSKMAKPYWDVPTSVGLSLDRVFNFNYPHDNYANNEHILSFIADLTGRGYVIVAPALKQEEEPPV